MNKARPEHSVALVINTFEQAHFLTASIESALCQTTPFSEIIVVDDESTDNPEAVTCKYPGVQLIRRANGGLAAARNTGLHAASSDYIVFLDADDLLTPTAVQSGLACHAKNPGAGLVYGAHRRIGLNGEPIGSEVYCEIGDNPFQTLLAGNAIGMHATVLYDRGSLREIGGFDAALPRCEDYDVYFRMAARYPIVSHSEVTALYRWYGQNMSANHVTMLKWVLRINDRQKALTANDPGLEASRLLGRRVWCRYYANEMALDIRRRWSSIRHPLSTLRITARGLSMVPRLAFELARWSLGRASGSGR